ncbi:unnamed protein product [Ectocarpus sp. 6 AP-2014]
MQSHRTLSRVRSLSSPPVIWLSLVLAIGGAAAAVPSWNTVVLTGTYFSPFSEDERDLILSVISRFFFEFIVGICMIGIVAWLLLFRMKEIKECWKVHTRIRYYFGLTLIATAVNLVLGIFGTVYIVGGRQRVILIVISWSFRHIHIALDTIVLYGVLGAPARQMDERGGLISSDPAVADSGSRNCSNPGSSTGGLRSLRRLSKRSSKPRVPPARQAQGRPDDILTTIRPSQSD